MCLVPAGSAKGSSTRASAYEMLSYEPTERVRVQYPRFFAEGMEAVNELIYLKAQEVAGEDVEELSEEYQCAVTLYTDKLLSLAFWGEGYRDGGMHPGNSLFGFTVDLATVRELRLEDLYVIDDQFEATFFEKAYHPTEPVTVPYGPERFSEMLAEQTDEYSAPFEYPEYLEFFLKPDGIVISMYAIHASGSDHFDAQLNYEDLMGNYRLDQKYWEE